MNTKQKGILIFVITVGLCIGAMTLAYFLVKDSPTQALCDDMMEVMNSEFHNQFHTDYAETMALLHGYINECYQNNMYDETKKYDYWQPSDYDRYMEDMETMRDEIP